MDSDMVKVDSVNSDIGIGRVKKKDCGKEKDGREGDEE